MYPARQRRESFAKTVVGAASSATTPCAKATPSLMPVWATRTASPARLGSARNGVVAKTFPKTAKTALSRNSGEKSRAAISAASVMSSRFGMSFKDRLSTASTRRRNAPRVSVRDDGPCKAAYLRGVEVFRFLGLDTPSSLLPRGRRRLVAAPPRPTT